MIDGVFGKRVDVRDFKRTVIGATFTALSGDMEVTADQLRVPNGYVLVMAHVMALAIPTGGENAMELTIGLIPPEATLAAAFPSGYIVIASVMQAASANRVLGTRYYGEMVLQPGWRIAVHGHFSAAVANKNLQCTVCGYMLPQANLLIS